MEKASNSTQIVKIAAMKAMLPIIATIAEPVGMRRPEYTWRRDQCGHREDYRERPHPEPGLEPEQCERRAVRDRRDAEYQDYRRDRAPFVRYGNQAVKRQKRADERQPNEHEDDEGPIGLISELR